MLAGRACLSDRAHNTCVEEVDDDDDAAVVHDDFVYKCGPQLGDVSHD